MNPIRLLRTHAGITQKAMAQRAKTSQPTIALYESGAKSPTLATLQRLASSLGLELFVSYVPPLTREEHRSLSYHRAVAKILRQDSLPALKRAKNLLARMKSEHPGAKALFNRWQNWLKLPTQDLILKILDPSLVARGMRKASPFAGLLTPEERARVLRQFRKEYR
jgi:transcriptional regulator with XRE-family HTH domain